MSSWSPTRTRTSTSRTPHSAVAYDRHALGDPVDAPPADLVAGTVTIPANAVPGQNITISYQVTNNGTTRPMAPGPIRSTSRRRRPGASATRSWARVAEDMDLAAGASYTGTLTAPLPGVNPGSYYVILRTNILDTIPETTLANNLSASLTQTSTRRAALTLGVPATGTLGERPVGLLPGRRWARARRCKSTSPARTAEFAQRAVRQFRQHADARATPTTASPQLAANQLITVPPTQAGHLLHPGLWQRRSRFAGKLLDHRLGNPLCRDGGKSGERWKRRTVDPRDRWRQVRSRHDFPTDRRPWECDSGQRRWDVQDAATAYATFNLTGAATGNYQVQATAAGGTTTTLATGLTVTTGSGANLQVSLSGPAEVLPDTTGVFEVNYANTGDADSGAPLIFVESPSGTAMGLTAAAVPYNDVANLPGN